jgi:RND superfamily putative drug exporter
VIDPFTAGTVSADGRTGLASVTFDRPSMEVGPEPLTSVHGALASAREAGLVAEVGGEAAFINGDSEPSGTEAAGLLAALVVLVVAFGTLVAALLPVVLAVVAVAAGLGGIALMANGLTVSTAAPTIAAMIGLGVGIDYALLVVARYRENRSTGLDNASALSAATATAGSAVLFAGGTVVVAMVALALTGMGFLRSIGLATALIVLLAMATALTCSPLCCRCSGTGSRQVGSAAGAPVPRGPATGRRLVALRPSRRGAPVALPAGGHRAAPRPGRTRPGHAHRLPRRGPRRAQQGPPAGVRPRGGGFGPGTNGPLLLVVDLTAPGVEAGDMAALATQVADDPGVASVSRPQTSAAGDTAVLTVVPTSAATDPETSGTVQRSATWRRRTRPSRASPP